MGETRSHSGGDPSYRQKQDSQALQSLGRRRRPQCCPGWASVKVDSRSDCGWGLTASSSQGARMRADRPVEKLGSDLADTGDGHVG